MLPPLYALVQRSYDEALAPLYALRRRIAGIGVGALVVALLIGVGLAGGITSPVQTLVAGMQEIVRKRYGRVEALRGISFSVEQGEFFGILGPNGAGKSTTGQKQRASSLLSSSINSVP